jgi:hypothetical protein
MGVLRPGLQTRGLGLMKYTIYEDPLTRKFALLALPARFVDGDTLPIIDVDRWFGSHEEAIAALPDLLNRDEPDSAMGLDDSGGIADREPG